MYNISIMDIPDRQTSTADIAPTPERLSEPVAVNFYKLGGTWDMIERDGRRVGTGRLDDDELKAVQTELGLFDADTRDQRVEANRQLAIEIYRRFEETVPEPVDTAEHLDPWAFNRSGERLGDYIEGPFTALFSGDSSHLRSPLIVPMATRLIDIAKREPNKPVLGGQGTDTADIALLALYDGFTYDTSLPPLILTGSNDPHSVPNSDAPENFVDTAKLTHVDLPAGAYWVFHGNVYRAVDFVKADPEESRRIEEQGTFWSPHKTIQSVESLLEFGRDANWQANAAPSGDHVVNGLTMEALYDAVDSVYVLDLGNQNASWSEMERIFDPSIKAVVVAAHSLGNVDNETRSDLIKAAKMDKLVVCVSRALVGQTNESYEASLLGANQTPGELHGTGRRIVAAHKLNRTIARALAARSLLQGLDQTQTQQLFTHYAQSRKMV